MFLSLLAICLKRQKLKSASLPLSQSWTLFIQNVLLGFSQFYTLKPIISVHSAEKVCSVRGLWRPGPAGRMPAVGRWQWPRPAQTSRSSAFHWTWGLEATFPSSSRRPIALCLWVTSHTLTFTLHQWKSLTQVQCCTLRSFQSGAGPPLSCEEKKVKSLTRTLGSRTLLPLAHTSRSSSCYCKILYGKSAPVVSGIVS